MTDTQAVARLDAEGRTAVYYLYDRRDVLLYVGIARDPQQRWRQHAADKHWWSDVCTRTVEWLSTLDEARRAEAESIATHHPVHNRSGSVVKGDVIDALPAVNMVDAKERLHVLVDAAARGEPTILARRGVPLAVLVSYQDLKNDLSSKDSTR